MKEDKKAKKIRKKQGKEERKERKIEEESIIRILSTDISGNKKIFVGLTKIKGVSWTLSNAVCYILDIDKNRKMNSLTKEEINKISELVKNPEDKIPAFILNRQKDIETGKDRHLIGSDLELRREFDIKRLKKIKSYRGLRHALRQPVRGQRTRSHFRERHRKAVGVSKKAKRGKKG